MLLLDMEYKIKGKLIMFDSELKEIHFYHENVKDVLYHVNDIISYCENEIIVDIDNCYINKEELNVGDYFVVEECGGSVYYGISGGKCNSMYEEFNVVFGFNEDEAIDYSNYDTSYIPYDTDMIRLANDSEKRLIDCKLELLDKYYDLSTNSIRKIRKRKILNGKYYYINEYFKIVEAIDDYSVEHHKHFNCYNYFDTKNSAEEALNVLINYDI